MLENSNLTKLSCYTVVCNSLYLLYIGYCMVGFSNQVYAGHRPGHAWSIKNFSVYTSICVHVWLCVCPLLRLLITSDMIRTPYDWLNRFYSFCMAIVVGIVSRHGFTVEGHSINQPNKCKQALCKL